MAQDILIGYFFDGKNPIHIADQQLELLFFASGLSPTYSGKSPTSAHLQLPPILTGHFDRRLTLLRQTLEDHKVAVEDIQIWIDFEDAFRAVVVAPSI